MWGGEGRHSSCPVPVKVHGRHTGKHAGTIGVNIKEESPGCPGWQVPMKGKKMSKWNQIKMRTSFYSSLTVTNLRWNIQEAVCESRPLAKVCEMDQISKFDKDIKNMHSWQSQNFFCKQQYSLKKKTKQNRERMHSCVSTKLIEGNFPRHNIDCKWWHLFYMEHRRHKIVLIKNVEWHVVTCV